MLTAIRHQQLQDEAKIIFKQATKLITPGITEIEAQSKIKIFLNTHPKIERLWHQVVVKFDESTKIPGVGYHPTHSKLTTISTVDLGFVISGIEVDYAKTWLVANNLELQNMIDSSYNIWQQAAKAIYSNSPSSLYKEILKLSTDAGYTFVAQSAGHRLGEFPTKKSHLKIKADESATKFLKGGQMIEIHISNEKFGSFYEDLVII